MQAQNTEVQTEWKEKCQEGKIGSWAKNMLLGDCIDIYSWNNVLQLNRMFYFGPFFFFCIPIFKPFEVIFLPTETRALYYDSYRLRMVDQALESRKRFAFEISFIWGCVIWSLHEQLLSTIVICCWWRGQTALKATSCLAFFVTLPRGGGSFPRQIPCYGQRPFFSYEVFRFHSCCFRSVARSD